MRALQPTGRLYGTIIGSVECPGVLRRRPRRLIIEG
jgi:hypothetical protein